MKSINSKIENNQSKRTNASNYAPQSQDKTDDDDSDHNVSRKTLYGVWSPDTKTCKTLSRTKTRKTRSSTGPPNISPGAKNNKNNETSSKKSRKKKLIEPARKRLKKRG